MTSPRLVGFEDDPRPRMLRTVAAIRLRTVRSARHRVDQPTVHHRSDAGIPGRRTAVFGTGRVTTWRRVTAAYYRDPRVRKPARQHRRLGRTDRPSSLDRLASPAHYDPLDARIFEQVSFQTDQGRPISTTARSGPATSRQPPVPVSEPIYTKPTGHRHD